MLWQMHFFVNSLNAIQKLLTRCNHTVTALTVSTGIFVKQSALELKFFITACVTEKWHLPVTQLSFGSNSEKTLGFKSYPMFLYWGRFLNVLLYCVQLKLFSKLRKSYVLKNDVSSIREFDFVRDYWRVSRFW